MEIVFWISICFIFYAYFGYPLVLYTLSLFRSRRLNRDPEHRPPVSFIITVHNEEKRIKEKIANTLALDYPPDKLEIIFASDASSDATDEIVKSCSELKLVRSDERRGKEYAQKCAVEQASGDILVFSDVATILEPDGLRQIVANFADDSVGCVSSEDRFIDDDGQVSGEGAYVKYEMFLRNLESRVNTLVGLSGSFFAARKKVCEGWATDIQSDFNTVLNAVKMGLRGISDPHSIGYYKNITDEKKEFDRKVRTVLRGIHVFMRSLPLLNPIKYGLFAWQLFSHKLCRWLVPFFMAIALISNASVAGRSVFYFSIFTLQIIFYALAFIYHKQIKHTAIQAGSSIQNLKSKIQNYFFSFSKLSYYFVSVNLSILLAWLKFLKGQKTTFWEPSKRN